jgi:hypothetical protein
MLEVTVDTLAIDAGAPSEDQLQAGLPPVVHCQVVGGTPMPFAIPGTNEPMRIPSVAVNFNLTKKAALEYADKLREAAEQLPDESTKADILTASSMSDVERVAQMDQQFRQK